MMAQKALMFKDTEIYNLIMKETDCKKIKSLGRKVHNFNAKRWNEVCFDIVCKGNYAKFTQNKKLRKILLSTQDKILAEASPYDTIWVIGMRANHVDAQDMNQWKGKNLLGKALMNVSDQIKGV